MKKSPYLILFLGIIMALFGLIASFVSAPKYGYLFVIIISCDLMALTCFGYLLRLGRRWIITVLVTSMLVLYTITDIALRLMFGIRVLDIMR